MLFRIIMIKTLRPIHLVMKSLIFRILKRLLNNLKMFYLPTIRSLMFFTLAFVVGWSCIPSYFIHRNVNCSGRLERFFHKNSFLDNLLVFTSLWEVCLSRYSHWTFFLDSFVALRKYEDCFIRYFPPTFFLGNYVDSERLYSTHRFSRLVCSFWTFLLSWLNWLLLDPLTFFLLNNVDSERLYPNTNLICPQNKNIMLHYTHIHD